MIDFDSVIQVDLNKDEQSLLASMMLHLACADKHIDPFETEFLNLFLKESLGMSIESAVLEVEAPSLEKIKQAGSDKADTIYLICSLLTCVDEHVDDAEIKLLNDYAQALGIDEGKREELNCLARRQVLDQAAAAMAAVAGYPEEKRAALAQIAGKIKATDAEIEAVAGKYGFA